MTRPHIYIRSRNKSFLITSFDPQTQEFEHLMQNYGERFSKAEVDKMLAVMTTVEPDGEPVVGPGMAHCVVSKRLGFGIAR